MATKKRSVRTARSARSGKAKRATRKVGARKRAQKRVVARARRKASRSRAVNRSRKADSRRVSRPKGPSVIARAASPTGPIRGAQALGGDQYVVVLAPNVMSAAVELGRGDLSAGITAAVVRVSTEKLALAISKQRPPRR